MNRQYLLGLVMGSAFVAGCLPGDTRPEPAQVFVQAEASAPSVNGFTTDDGWAIKFERLLVGLGNIQLVGDNCNNYANAGYDRLFDFTHPGATKLGDVYGLGGCELQFRLRPPSSEALLESGVSETDRAFMRDSIVMADPTQIPTDGPPPRMAVYMSGVATRAAETKRFDWKFILRYTLSDCENVADGTRNTFLHLAGGDTLHPVISFHAEDLFQWEGMDGVVRRFGHFAGVDANSDGNVTLEEIETLASPVDEGGLVNPDPNALKGWAGYMSVVLLPKALYFDGNRCQLLPQKSGPGGGGGPGPF